MDWLSWPEYCYNTSFHTALRATPFKVVYGRPPPPLLPYSPGTARTEAADALLQSRDEILAEVRQRLLQAQQLSKKYYDAGHRDVEFQVGDWVWLRLLNRTAQSLSPGAKGKLGPRYAGPFRVLERLGAVAYRLQLPEGARLHDVFHVGLLKRHRGDAPATPASLAPTFDGRYTPAPAKALRVQWRRDTWQVLIQWHGFPEEDATWESVDEFRSFYPDFQLEDELFEKAGRDVMTGIQYSRRRPSSG